GGALEQNSILVDYEANRSRSVLAVNSGDQHLLEGGRSVLRGRSLAVHRSNRNGDSCDNSQQKRRKRYPTLHVRLLHGGKECRLYRGVGPTTTLLPRATQ